MKTTAKKLAGSSNHCTYGTRDPAQSHHPQNVIPRTVFSDFSVVGFLPLVGGAG
jgi:hypothetical protein